MSDISDHIGTEFVQRNQQRHGVRPSKVDRKKTRSFEDFRPKEARLRVDQLAELKRITQTLQDARTDKTYRITENTLIRIAVDFLLANWGLSMRGNDEEELRERFFRACSPDHQ